MMKKINKKNWISISVRLALLLFFVSNNAYSQTQDVLDSLLRIMAKEISPKKNITLMAKIIQEQKLDAIKNREDFDIMNGIVALSYLKAGNNSKFETYIKKIQNKFNQTSYLNMATEWLAKETSLKAYAEKVAYKTVLLYNSYKNDSLAKPKDFPSEDWIRFISMAAYPYYETYARTLFNNKKYHQALIYEEQALEKQEFENIDISSVQLYTELLAIEGYEEKAFTILETMTVKGKCSSEMEATLKRLYVKKGGNSSYVNQFIDSLKFNQSLNYKSIMFKKMQRNVVAPYFNLLDLSGNQVSLLDLRGKIVVLDFWATWCTPCLASMPAMKKIQEQHPDVVFLFIATQEIRLNAVDYIKYYMQKNGYAFKTILDMPSIINPNVFPISSSYKIKKLPTKVVIDKNGMIRFSTEGFFSETELIKELEVMITLANES